MTTGKKLIWIAIIKELEPEMMTDEELRQAISNGFANPLHLDELLKVIKVPKELLNLPTLWRHTDSSQRRQQLLAGNGAAAAPSQIKTALNVLERCLRVLSTHSPPDSIPEEMMSYWAFEADFLAEKMPSFDEFHIDKIKEFLLEYGIKSPSVVLQKDCARFFTPHLIRSWSPAPSLK